MPVDCSCALSLGARSSARRTAQALTGRILAQVLTTSRDIKTRLIDSQPQTEQPVKLGGADSGSVNVAKQNQSNQSGGCC
jgi:hypothetical protein